MSEEIDEIWALYADDGGQALDGVEEALLALKANSDDGEAIAGLFRAMHTFKGNSRLLGLTAIESCAHLAEDLIGLVRDDGIKFDVEFLALLLEATDVLRAMMEATLSTRRDAAPEAAASVSERIREKFERSRTGAAAYNSVSQPFSAAAAAGNDAPLEFGESTEAIIFEPFDARLAEDPLYREIFLELARDCLAELRQAHDILDPREEAWKTAVADTANRLRLAAEQIGIAEWPEMAGQLVSGVHRPESVEATIARMIALYECDLAALDNGRRGGVVAPADEFVEFVDRLEPLISGLIAAAEGLRRGEHQNADHIQAITSPIAEAAELLGYVRLADTAGRFTVLACDKVNFHHLLFELYIDLKLIEELSADAESGRFVEPRAFIAVLGAWCTAQGESVLNELHDLIVSDLRQADTDAAERLLHHIKAICNYNGAEVAGRVAMTLSDLISRIESLDLSGHPIVGQIETFIALAAPIFSSKTAAAAPDMTAMDDLLRRLTVECSLIEGAQWVEASLGLPAHLQGCLTSSSAKAAQAGLQEGKRFYVIRADFSANEDMAKRFIAWVEGGSAAIISSVTVFQGTTTVFDFLIASALERDALEIGIGKIDPEGVALRLEMSLPSTIDNVAKMAPAEAAMTSQQDFNSTSLAASAALLESIGELVTGHSAMRHVVSDFEEEDLFALIEAQLRNYGGNWNNARASIRSLLDSRQERVAELGQIQTQMAALLGLVQAEALSSRSRPASSLLDALAAFGESDVHRCGRTVSVKTSGGSEAVDLGLLQILEEPLRQLVSVCLDPMDTASGESQNCISISLAQNADHVCVTVEAETAAGALRDAAMTVAKSGVDGAKEDFEPHAASGLVGLRASRKSSNIEAIRRVLRLKGGDLRNLKPTNATSAFRVTMPLATAVLEGMVVRVGDVRYVVPIHSIQRIVHSDSHDLIRVSASSGRLMLKLSQDEVLPVSHLAGNGIASLPSADLLHTASAQNDNPLEDADRHLFVVAGDRTRRVALAIDELVGQQTVLLRPLKGYLSAIRDVTGCALLGSGGVGMVLDIRAILERE